MGGQVDKVTIEETWQRGGAVEVEQALRLFSVKELAVLRDHYVERVQLQAGVAGGAGPLLSVADNLAEAALALDAAIRLDTELSRRKEARAREAYRAEREQPA